MVKHFIKLRKTYHYSKFVLIISFTLRNDIALIPPVLREVLRDIFRNVVKAFSNEISKLPRPCIFSTSSMAELFDTAVLPGEARLRQLPRLGEQDGENFEKDFPNLSYYLNFFNEEIEKWGDGITALIGECFLEESEDELTDSFSQMFSFETEESDFEEYDKQKIFHQHQSLNENDIKMSERQEDKDSQSDSLSILKQNEKNKTLEFSDSSDSDEIEINTDSSCDSYSKRKVTDKTSVKRKSVEKVKSCPCLTAMLRCDSLSEENGGKLTDFFVVLSRNQEFKVSFIYLSFNCLILLIFFYLCLSVSKSNYPLETVCFTLHIAYSLSLFD